MVRSRRRYTKELEQLQNLRSLVVTSLYPAMFNHLRYRKLLKPICPTNETSSILKACDKRTVLLLTPYPEGCRNAKNALKLEGRVWCDGCFTFHYLVDRFLRPAGTLGKLSLCHAALFKSLQQGLSWR